MTSLLDPAPDWVTLRATTEEGAPVVVLVDRAIATTAPYDGFGTQVAVAVTYGSTEDGLPGEQDREGLRTVEQSVVDAAAGEGRLVAVMTLEGVREWVLYARSTGWVEPFRAAGLSVVVTDDPAYAGLQELAGAAR